jgi:hypothetical protein
MDQHFKTVNRSWQGIAIQGLALMLWVIRRLLRVLLRRPILDVLLVFLALWLIAGFIGRRLAPEPVLYQSPTLFEGR